MPKSVPARNLRSPKLIKTSSVQHVQSSPPAPPRAQPPPDPETALVEGCVVPLYTGVGLARAVCEDAGAALYPECEGRGLSSVLMQLSLWISRLNRIVVQASKTDVVFVSYETSKPPDDVTAFIKARRKDPVAVQKEIVKRISSSKRMSHSCLPPPPQVEPRSSGTLLIFDTLYPLATHPTLPLPSFLSSLTSPSTSLLAIYHTDIPLPPPSTSNTTPYTPTPLTLLQYLATTILTTYSLSQTLARKRAIEKSLSEPLFGLEEEREGVLVGIGANDSRGVVVRMEYRRKSGRGVEEWFYLPELSGMDDRVVLLDDHELFRRTDGGVDEEGVEGRGGGSGAEMATFELGLTEKQRRDREGVVLPYFDAQKGDGGGGGRILYDMGVEDDFDEEEDEI